jgi:hypothetical protein
MTQVLAGEASDERAAETSAIGPHERAAPTALPSTPKRPGRYRFTAPDGTARKVRVIERNSQLYVVQGKLNVVAVPIAQFEGTWQRLD